MQSKKRDFRLFYSIFLQNLNWGVLLPYISIEKGDLRANFVMVSFLLHFSSEKLSEVLFLMGKIKNQTLAPFFFSFSFLCSVGLVLEGAW